MSRLLGSPRAPALVLAAGTAVLAAFAAVFATRITGWTIDETLFKQSALHYTSGLPSSIFHDLTARGTSRLYPLILSPIMGSADGADAIRIARALSAVVFCSTSIPVYLLARRVLSSRWAAVAAALLSIAVPWLTLTTVLFSENVAYPLFAWTLFAMVRAIDRPSPWSDVIVLVLIGLSTTARTQLLILFPAWLVAVWIIGRRRAWRIAPVSHALLGLALLGLLARFAMGKLHADLQRLFGQYSEIQDRGHVSTDLFRATVVEVQSFLLPALTAGVAALAWFAGALRDGRANRRWGFAIVALCVFAFLWLFTAYVQGGFLGAATEERYFFYVFPLLWIGAFLALEEPAVAGPRLVPVAIVVVLLVATLGIDVPLEPEKAFLAPATFSLRSAAERIIASWHLVGLSVRDLLTLVSLVLLAAAFWAWRRSPRARLAAVVVVAAVTQIAAAAYAYAARDGHVPPIPSDTAGDFSRLAWVDRAVGPDTVVTWVNNQPRSNDRLAEGRQYETLFWNSRIREWAHDNATALPLVVPTLAALPMRTITSDPARPEITGLEPGRPIVQFIDSPFLQIAGRRIATGPFGDLGLFQPTAPVRALFLSRGLLTDGEMDPGKRIELVAFPPVPDQGVELDLTFLGTPAGATRVGVRIDGKHRVVALQQDKEQAERFEACPTGGRVAGALRVLDAVGIPEGRQSGGRLLRVKVSPMPGLNCRR
jgi:hypothetical protein